MNSKMTTNSQLSTTEPTQKQKQPEQNQEARIQKSEESYKPLG